MVDAFSAKENEAFCKMLVLMAYLFSDFLMRGSHIFANVTLTGNTRLFKEKTMLKSYVFNVFPNIIIILYFEFFATLHLGLPNYLFFMRSHLKFKNVSYSSPLTNLFRNIF